MYVVNMSKSTILTVMYGSQVSTPSQKGRKLCTLVSEAHTTLLLCVKVYTLMYGFEVPPMSSADSPVPDVLKKFEGR
jgi:hypothetical protein